MFLYISGGEEVLNGAVSVDENIVLNNLSVGQYLINLTTCIDGNHSQTSNHYIQHNKKHKNRIQ